MLLPMFSLNNHDLDLGQTVDLLKLEICEKQNNDNEVSRYTFRYRKNDRRSGWTFKIYSIKKDSIVKDLSKFLNISQEQAFNLLIKGKFEWLSKYLIHPEIMILSFEYVYKYDEVHPDFLKQKQAIPFIFRMFYGVNLFVVVHDTDENQKAKLSEVIEKHLNNEHSADINRLFTLISPNSTFNSAHQLISYLKTLQCDQSRCFKIELTEKPLNLENKTNFEEIWKDISLCNTLAKNLQSYITQPYKENKSLKFDLKHFESLIDEVKKSPIFPAELFAEILHCYKTTLDNLLNNKENLKNISTIKKLMAAAITTTKNYVKIEKTWFLKAEALKSTSKYDGDYFFITNGHDTPQAILEFCMKQNYIITFTGNKEIANRFILNENGKKYMGFGIIKSGKHEKNYKGTTSHRRFTYLCPCKSTEIENYCICPECNSFVTYYPLNIYSLSCKCKIYETNEIIVESFQVCCRRHEGLKAFSKELPLKNQQSAPNCNCYNVIIIGPSGTGKSTYVNAIHNYVKYETIDEALKAPRVHYVIPCKWEFQVTENDELRCYDVIMGDMRNGNEKINDSGYSVTQKPRKYCIQITKTSTAQVEKKTEMMNDNDELLRIIDTPGLADTRGIKQDDINLKEIKKIIAEVGSLHAVCFILKPNESKLTPEFEMTLQSLLSILPQEAIQRVVFCFTYTRGCHYKIGDSRGPIEMFIKKYEQVSNARIPFGKDNVFYTDNEGFPYLCAKKQYPHINDPDNDAEDYEKSWKVSRSSTFKFFDYLRNVMPISTKEVGAHNDIAKITNLWDSWIEKVSKDKLTDDRIERFGTVAQYIEQNMITSDGKRYTRFAEINGYKAEKIYISTTKLFDSFLKEFHDPSTDDDIAREIIKFLIEVNDQ